MTATQAIAGLLWSASMDIARPEFHRHEAARRDLLRAMRSTAAPDMMARGRS